MAASIAAMLAFGLTACGPRNKGAVVNPGEANADKYLFDRGNESLTRKHWLEAREYFRKLVDTYPTSPYRQDAKLGIGDTYLGERRSDSDVLAANEFREFLRYYPLASKADYAQYRLALSQVRQELSPERDQTATHEALRELNTFVANYPQSQWLPDVMKLLRETRDKLSDSEFFVGRQYYRTRWYPGAVSRLTELLKTDPQYTRRDGAYFFLAEAYYKQDKKPDALALYEKLIGEFRVSDYLKDARERIAVLQAEKVQVADSTAATAVAPAAAPSSAPSSSSTTPSTTPSSSATPTIQTPK
ncbi:MAG: outer membrane protein assembly factor BamD [Acidobacteriota bacterium]